MSGMSFPSILFDSRQSGLDHGLEDDDEEEFIGGVCLFNATLFFFVLFCVERKERKYKPMVVFILHQSSRITFYYEAVFFLPWLKMRQVDLADWRLDAFSSAWRHTRKLLYATRTLLGKCWRTIKLPWQVTQFFPSL